MGYHVTVRPHPQYLKRFPQEFEEICRQCSSLPADRFAFELDFSSNESVFSSELLITDWSGIGFEYALATERPTMFVDTPMKVVNARLDISADEEPPFDIRMRGIVGKSVAPEEVREKAGAAARELIVNSASYAETIAALR